MFVSLPPYQRELLWSRTGFTCLEHPCKFITFQPPQAPSTQLAALAFSPRFHCQGTCISSYKLIERHRSPDRSSERTILESVSYRVIPVVLFLLGLRLFCSWSPSSQKISTNVFKQQGFYKVFIHYNWRTDHTQREVESLVLFTVQLLDKSQLLSSVSPTSFLPGRCLYFVLLTFKCKIMC